jgi:hypothetical protein
LSSLTPPKSRALSEKYFIKRNKPTLSFAKKKLRKAAKILIGRFVEKAELVEASIVYAMMEDG